MRQARPTQAMHVLPPNPHFVYQELALLPNLKDSCHLQQLVSELGAEFQMS